MTQPKIEGVGHGIPVMPFFSDGADWIAALIDGDGHLQVDIISSALAADAATETTLAEVSARIGDESSPASGTTNKLLTDALTALQKIDDLQNALASVASDLLRVEAEDGDKIWSFESVVAKVKTGVADASTYSLDSDAVPSGKVWVITNIDVRNLGGDIATRLVLYVVHDAAVIALKDVYASTAQYQHRSWSGHAYLDAEDFIRCTFVGVASSETVEINIVGYQMNAP